MWCQHLFLVMANGFCVYLVEGGHRAIIFSRIGGIQQDIYREGLHFRYASLLMFDLGIFTFDVFILLP